MASISINLVWETLQTGKKIFVGSNVSTMLSDGRIVRGREYPWGTVNIEDKVGIELAKDFLCQVFY